MTRADTLSGQLDMFAEALRISALGSSTLLRGLADDVRSGGEVGNMLTGHPSADQPLFGLRAVAGLHLLMMEGLVPDLEAAMVHATSVPESPSRLAELWPLARHAMLRHGNHIAEALDRPVQQHEPHRTAALLDGLCMLGVPRVRLLELGACAGVGLLVDRYRWSGASGVWGPPESPLLLPAGPRARPHAFTIVERAGCDLAPRNPRDPGDIRVLRSFIPPEHGSELRTLDAALRLAADTGVRVEQAAAGDWLRRRLAVPTADPDVCTVVWHSLLWLYLDRDEQRAVERAIEEFAGRGSIAHIAYEPAEWGRPVRLSVTAYS
ncbi:DUF2332 family protein [Streptomyces sp. NPDC056632]|uniref:DUF2332 family protein n=1 Tax=Streptomyces sp. NPDC056632 TaxID=3345884 RepID=UPI0036CC75B5